MHDVRTSLHHRGDPRPAPFRVAIRDDIGQGVRTVVVALRAGQPGAHRQRGAVVRLASERLRQGLLGLVHAAQVPELHGEVGEV